MPAIIRYHDNKNEPLITRKHPLLFYSYFNLIRLQEGGAIEIQIPEFECVYVVLSGNCTIEVSGEKYLRLGARKDIWSGKADSLYAPRGATVSVVANCDGTEIAIAGGLCDTEYAPFRIPPEEVETVKVGSSDTKSCREICHILGHNGLGRACNLLVSELYAEEGCWSGYPPHKHDEEQGEEESAFEETYHFRFRPETGFGAQIVYQPDGYSVSYMTRNGDTVIIDRGYHPTVTSPGHAEYILAILVGKQRRSLLQNFHEKHRHLMRDIPGIAEMQAKFK